MPNRSSNPKKPKLPADVNQRGKAIVDFLTRDEDETQPKQETAPPTTEEPPDPIREAAKALGRRGGLKGGKARAESLSAKKRSEIAKKAAKARWKKE